MAYYIFVTIYLVFPRLGGHISVKSLGASSIASCLVLSVLTLCVPLSH